jgi:hypothetical protein
MGSLFGSSYFHGCLLEFRLKGVGVYLKLLECQKNNVPKEGDDMCVLFCFVPCFLLYKGWYLIVFYIEDRECLVFIPFF